QEDLADSPNPVLRSSGPFVVWTDWRKRDFSGRFTHEQYDIFAARPGRRNVQVDPYGPRPVSTFAASACAAGGRTTLVAYQDASAPQSRIELRRIAGGRAGGRALRVDDGGAAAGNAWRPQL